MAVRITQDVLTARYFRKFVGSAGVGGVKVKRHFVSVTDKSYNSSTCLIYPSNNGCIISLFLYQKPNHFSEHFFTERTFSSRSGSKRSAYYYEVLGLKPSATQGQIKSAYYKMSKLYHPDVSTKPESHTKFTEINQAYEVLGDVKKRRMYDIGLGQRTSMNPSTVAGQGDPSDISDHTKDTQNEPDASPYFRDANKFDEFYKQHYNEIRQRRKKEHSQYMHDKNLHQKSYSQGMAMQRPITVICSILFISIVVKSLLS